MITSSALCTLSNLSPLTPSGSLIFYDYDVRKPKYFRSDTNLWPKSKFFRLIYKTEFYYRILINLWTNKNQHPVFVLNLI